MGIPLYMQENILKFIGGLHIYLHHTIHMFNPTNLDEGCVQATHNESKSKSVLDFSLAKSIQSKEGKEKGKGKNTNTMRKGDERPTCSHCKIQGHEEENCWELNLELKPKWFKDRKKEAKGHGYR